MSPTFSPEQASAALERLGPGVDEIDWYHTQELAPGLVTPGMFDLRPYVDRYGLPESIAGMRVLDVGTFEGFWAFEMERRGAEVVALDIDASATSTGPRGCGPPRAGSGARASRSRGRRSAVRSSGSRCSIYGATPETRAAST